MFCYIFQGRNPKALNYFHHETEKKMKNRNRNFFAPCTNGCVWVIIYASIILSETETFHFWNIHKRLHTFFALFPFLSFQSWNLIFWNLIELYYIIQSIILKHGTVYLGRFPLENAMCLSNLQKNIPKSKPLILNL